MTDEQLIASLKDKILREGFVKVNEELKEGENSDNDYRLTIAHKIAEDARFMQDPTNEYKVFKNPNYQLTQSVLRTNKIQVWTLGITITLTIVSTFIALLSYQKDNDIKLILTLPKHQQQQVKDTIK